MRGHRNDCHQHRRSLAIDVCAMVDWRTGAALNIVDNCLLVGFTLVRRDASLGRFLLFGIVVGFCELPSDAWLVDYTGTLDYSIGGGPLIWRSPLWMPLAWEVVAVQFGYVGLYE